MLGCDLVTGIEDLLIRSIQRQRLSWHVRPFRLAEFFKFLTFLDDRVKFFSDDFVIILFKRGALLIDARSEYDRDWF